MRRVVITLYRPRQFPAFGVYKDTALRDKPDDLARSRHSSSRRKLACVPNSHAALPPCIIYAPRAARAYKRTLFPRRPLCARTKDARLGFLSSKIGRLLMARPCFTLFLLAAGASSFFGAARDAWYISRGSEKVCPPLAVIMYFSSGFWQLN